MKLIIAFAVGMIVFSAAEAKTNAVVQKFDGSYVELYATVSDPPKLKNDNYTMKVSGQKIRYGDAQYKTDGYVQVYCRDRINFSAGDCVRISGEYVRPQENMAHVETHWMKVYTEAGHGLQVLPAKDTETLSFNCCHFTPVQISKTRHDYELVPKKETVVNIDYRNSGIGSNSCGPWLDRKYRIESGEHRFAFRILPFKGEV